MNHTLELPSYLEQDEAVKDPETNCKDVKSVIDPFAGSGSIALACEAYGINWVSIEQDKEYCDIIVKRLTEATHQLRLFSA